MLYAVDAVLSVCCTRCNAVLGVHSRSQQGAIERNDLTLICDNGSVVEEKERDGGR